MAARLGWADAVSGAPSYVGRALRQLSSVFLGGATAARPLGATNGVRPGTPASIVTATSTTWTVTPFAGSIDLEAAAIAGPYQFSFDANSTGVVTAAGGSARIDILYVRVNDGAEGDGTVVAPFVEVGYLAGTVASTAPAAPARSFVIAQINVPASGGGSPTVTWVAPYVVAAGGIQPVPAGAYPASPYVGQYVDDASIGLVRWNGTGWVAVGGGLALIKPSSVVGGTISGNGTVIVAGASTISINGVFSSAYDNYQIVFDVSGSSAASLMTMNLRAAGADNTAASYSYQITSGTGSTPGAAVSLAQSIWATTAATRFIASGDVKVFNPALPVSSRFVSNEYGVNGSTQTMAVSGGVHNVSAAFDGITFKSGAATMIGTFRIYGYNNG